MNERQRMQYLEAMGIDSYMPRRSLLLGPAVQLCQPVPDAVSVNAESVALNGQAQALTDIVANGSNVASSSDFSSAAPNVVPSVDPDVSTAPLAQSAEQLLGQVSASPENSAKSVQGAPVSQSPNLVGGLPREQREQREQREGQTDKPLNKRPYKQATNTPRFSLSIWRVTEDLLVVDSRQAELALPTEALLRNILQALSIPMGRLPSARVVHWPMLENHFADQGEEQARSALQAMLQDEHEEQPFKHVLLMGADACHYLCDQPSASTVHTFEALQGKAIKLAGFQAVGPEALVSDATAQDVVAVVIPSLVEMLQQPSLKAITWQAIQGLRR